MKAKEKLLTGYQIKQIQLKLELINVIHDKIDGKTYTLNNSWVLFGER